MNAHNPSPARLTDVQLVLSVIDTAARAEAEIEAAYRFKDRSDAREWHLERADQATVELLGLINAPQYRDVWLHLVRLLGPADMTGIKAFFAPVSDVGSLS